MDYYTKVMVVWAMQFLFRRYLTTCYLNSLVLSGLNLCRWRVCLARNILNFSGMSCALYASDLNGISMMKREAVKKC